MRRLISLFFGFVLLHSNLMAEDVYGRKTNALSHYKANFIEVKRIGKLIVNGQDGLILGLSDNNSKLFTWLSTYRSSITEIMRGFEASGNYSLFAKKLETLITDSTYSLSTNSADLVQKKAAILTMAAGLRTEPVPYVIPGFESQQKHYDNMRSAIFDAIATGLTANEKLFSDLLALQDDFAGIFRQRLKLILIAQGIQDIETKLAEIDLVLKRPTIVAAYLRAVSAAQSRFTEAYLTLDGGRMVSSLAELKSACERYFGFIHSQPDLNAHSIKEQEVINRTCQGSPEQWAQLTEDIYANDLRRMFADSIIYYRAPIVDRYCRERNEGKFQCNLYAWAGKLNHEDMLALSESDFQKFAQVWESISKGRVVK